MIQEQNAALNVMVVVNAAEPDDADEEFAQFRDLEFADESQTNAPAHLSHIDGLAISRSLLSDAKHDIEITKRWLRDQQTE